MSRHEGLPACLPECCQVRPSGHRQQGMAVLSVLVIVAVIGLLAAALMVRQTTAIRTAQVDQDRAQAYWLLRGEVSRVQAVLRAEAKRTPVVQLDGVWARPLVGTVVGELSGEAARVFSEVIDEQSKFNLRNLVNVGLVDVREVGAFMRLCSLLGLSNEQASLIARRVVVSLVSADQENAGSITQEEIKVAEIAAQEIGLVDLGNKDRAPRLRDITDLLAVPGIDAASVARLQPYVTILPQQTWINANTARPEVLAACVPSLSIERAKAMLDARDRGQWFINRGDFANRLKMPGVDETEILIGVTSQWFRVSSALRTSSTTLLMQALLHDDKKSLPQVMWLREGA